MRPGLQCTSFNSKVVYTVNLLEEMDMRPGLQCTSFNYKLVYTVDLLE